MMKSYVSMLVLVAIASPAGALLTEQEPGNNNVATAAIQMTLPAVDNLAVTDTGLLTFGTGGGDIDYLGIGGLRAGDIVQFTTTPLGDPPDFEIPDTIVGLFTASGAADCIGDDAFNNDLDTFPTGFGSLCRYQVPADGNYYVGITGFSANPFDGAHYEEGIYALAVSVTRLPEPGALLQLASGALGLAVLQACRRRANG